MEEQSIAYPVVTFIDGEPYEMPNEKLLVESVWIDCIDGDGPKEYVDANGRRVCFKIVPHLQKR